MVLKKKIKWNFQTNRLMRKRRNPIKMKSLKINFSKKGRTKSRKVIRIS